MRISDWSSDVCSSDLPGRRHIVGDGRADLGQFDPETGEAGFDIGHDHSLAVREGSCSAGSGLPVAASRAMRRPSQRSLTAASTALRSEQGRGGKEVGVSLCLWFSLLHTQKKKKHVKI